MATRRQFLVIAGGSAAVVAAGAAGFALLPGDEKPTGLPKVKFGGEKCARCGMLIGDKRFAAAWRDSSSKEQHFDDIGCMVLQAGERGPGPGAQYWVSDFKAESWLEVAAATFVISPGIKTPMSYGVVAVSTAEAAGTLAQSVNGQVSAWEGLPKIIGKKG